MLGSPWPEDDLDTVLNPVEDIKVSECVRA
jgi:hypothetical protein